MGMTSSLIQLILHRNWLYSVVVHMAAIKRWAPSYFRRKIRKIEAKEIPSCLIPCLLVVFTSPLSTYKPKKMHLNKLCF